MALTHGVYTVFMVNAAKETVYTPWVNAMSAAFTRIEWSKKISNLSEVWILKKKKKKRIAEAGTRILALPTRRPVVLPLCYFGTCWHKLKQNINKLCSDTWPNVYSPPRFMNCWYTFYFVFVFDVRLCLHVVFSKTSMVWILRWIYLRSEAYCLLSVVLSFAFLSVVFKKIFFGLIIS